MTVMAAEAAAGSAGSGAAATRAGAGAKSARGAAPGAGRASRSSRTAPTRPQASRQRKPPPTAMRRQGETGQAWLQRQSDAPPPTTEIIPGDGGRYRRIVLAEFAATVVLVGASPFLAPRRKGQTPEQFAAEFTLAQPLVRLSAVCIVFFVLALLANGPRSGRLAAAFGGLVLAGTALNATTALQGLTAVFSRGPSTGTDLGTSVGAGAGIGAAAGTPDESSVGGAF